MTCRTDVANGFAHRLCPDAAPVDGDRLRSVVHWTTRDEITLRAPDIDHSIDTTLPGVKPRVARDGVMGLIGNPARLFPYLDTQFRLFDFTVSARGYLPRAFHKVQLGPMPGFPGFFASKDMGVVDLHRGPLVLRGKTVQRTGGVEPTPLAGVNVELAGVWSTFPIGESPDPSLDPPFIEPPTLASLHPGLYADRRSGVDGLRRRDMVLAPIAERKSLVRPAVVGDTTVRISDRVNLSAGDVLTFESGVRDRVEYVTVDAIHPASTDDQPATIDLVHPLAVAHEEGTSCIKATPQAPGANNLFTRDGIPFDCVAFLLAMTGIVEGAVVEIGGGTSKVEYQTARLFETVSDAQGFYRMPPISRVAMVKLVAPAFVPPPGVVVPPFVWSLDYDRYENLADVLFP